MSDNIPTVGTQAADAQAQILNSNAANAFSSSINPNWQADEKSRQDKFDAQRLSEISRTLNAGALEAALRLNAGKKESADSDAILADAAKFLEFMKA